MARRCSTTVTLRRKSYFSCAAMILPTVWLLLMAVLTLLFPPNRAPHPHFWFVWVMFYPAALLIAAGYELCRFRTATFSPEGVLLKGWWRSRWHSFTTVDSIHICTKYQWGAVFYTLLSVKILASFLVPFVPLKTKPPWYTYAVVGTARNPQHGFVLLRLHYADWHEVIANVPESLPTFHHHEKITPNEPFWHAITPAKYQYRKGNFRLFLLYCVALVAPLLLLVIFV